MPPIRYRAVPIVLSLEQCRVVDQYAIEQLKIPGVVLMENAGRNAADLIERWLRDRLRRQAAGSAPVVPRNQICLVCGRGNNGGDGFVIARQLANRGYPVSVDLAADPVSLRGDAAVNHEIASRMGIPIRPLNAPDSLAAAAERWRSAAIVVDALLGTGFSGEIRDPMAGIIRSINALRDSADPPLIVAVDVPSGLDANGGTATGPAIEAHRTVTFLARKTGYQKKTARGYLGRVMVADIGAPLELILDRLGITISRHRS